MEEISYSFYFENGKIMVEELKGEYFIVDNNLEIEPSYKMEKKMESIIEEYFGTTDNKDLKQAMTKKLFKSRKPEVSKERRTIKNLVIIIEEERKELTNLLNSTSATLYNKEDCIYNYIGWVMGQKIYDAIGKEYDKEELKKKKEEARIQINIEVTKGAYEQLEALVDEIQDEETSNNLSIILKKAKESERVFKSLETIKDEIIASIKLVNWELEIERYPADTSEIKKTIILGLEKIISSIENKVNKTKSKEYLEIEDAISSLGISKDEGLDFNNL